MAAPNPLAEPVEADGVQGDVAAQLYDQHREGLYAYALSLLGNPVAAEDVVQDAFLRFFDYGQPVASVRAFLFTVARNRATDVLREAAARGRYRADVSRRGLTRTAEEDPRLNRLQKAVLVELDRLPDEQRETVVLKVYGRLTFPQIAEVTGVPAGTAASRYRYALAKLAERLTEGEERI